MYYFSGFRLCGPEGGKINIRVKAPVEKKVPPVRICI